MVLKIAGYVFLISLVITMLLGIFLYNSANPNGRAQKAVYYKLFKIILFVSGFVWVVAKIISLFF